MDGLKAGRELDALIAEKVFDWDSVETEGASCYDGALGYPPEYRSNLGCKMAFKVPHYSTDIAAAWQVVEKLKTRNVDSSESSGIDVGEMPFVLRFTQNNTWEAGWELNYYTSGILEEAETAPLAICLAALKAVGVS